jgi:hypothetical protein
VINSVFRARGLAPDVAVEEVSQEGMVWGVLAVDGVTIVTASTARRNVTAGVAPFMAERTSAA